MKVNREGGLCLGCRVQEGVALLCTGRASRAALNKGEQGRGRTLWFDVWGARVQEDVGRRCQQ